jgi:cytochrome oxidase Cu insertion factor (SCO1/SenC/PrrC family)
MDHSSIIYLMSPGGKFLGTIEGEQPVDDVAAQIAKHIT